MVTGRQELQAKREYVKGKVQKQAGGQKQARKKTGRQNRQPQKGWKATAWIAQ